MDSTVESRFRERTVPGAPDACWLWTGAHDGGGYGTLSVNNRTERTHRIAYVLSGHSLTPGMTIDHLCRNRGCVNPRHLEEVTRGENVRRGGVHRRKEFCIRGHRLAETRSRSGSCRACHNEYSLAKYHARKQLKGRQRTECREGHPLSGANLRVLTSGERQCIICAQARSRRHAQAKCAAGRCVHPSHQGRAA